MHNTSTGEWHGCQSKKCGSGYGYGCKVGLWIFFSNEKAFHPSLLKIVNNWNSLNILHFLFQAKKNCSAICFHYLSNKFLFCRSICYKFEHIKPVKLSQTFQAIKFFHIAKWCGFMHLQKYRMTVYWKLSNICPHKCVCVLVITKWRSLNK